MILHVLGVFFAVTPGYAAEAAAAAVAAAPMPDATVAAAAASAAARRPDAGAVARITLSVADSTSCRASVWSRVDAAITIGVSS